MPIKPYDRNVTDGNGVARAFQVVEGVLIAPNGVTAWTTDKDGAINGLPIGTGSATAPSLNFGGQTNKGLYSPAADQVGMTVAGVAQCRWVNGAFDLLAGSPWLRLLTNSAQIYLGVSSDVILSWGGANQLVMGGAAAAATSSATILKRVTAIADNTATATFTVSIPNAAHSAALTVTLVGSLGAGGAIGANEASGTVSYDIAIARTAGVNAVVVASAAYGSGMANVAGAATITVTAAVSAISGAVGAVNTFTVNVTIAHGSGASTNHTCEARATLHNANATGVTIA